uniref:Uncharacterized protein n=1 Tax=Helianthus annuus TaxID=4232 RepID=A0A251SFW4_HELAN
MTIPTNPLTSSSERPEHWISLTDSLLCGFRRSGQSEEAEAIFAGEPYTGAYRHLIFFNTHNISK